MSTQLGVDNEDLEAALEIMEEQGIPTGNQPADATLVPEPEKEPEPVVEETKEEEATEEELDFHNQNPFKPAAPAAPAEPAASPQPQQNEAVLEENRQLKAQLESYEKLFQNEQLAWAVSQVNEGKSILDAVRDVMPLDIDKMSFEDLYEIQLEELSKKFKLSEETVKRKREEFAEKDEFEKAELVDGIREKLERKNEEKKGLFKVDPSKVKPTAEDFDAKIKAANNTYVDKVTETVTRMEGQSFYGLAITEKRQKAVFDALSKSPIETFTINDDGIAVPNGEVVAELAYYRALVPELIETLSKNVSNEAKLELLRERQNIKDPNDVKGGGNMGKAKSPVLTAEEAAEAQERQTNALNYSY